MGKRRFRIVKNPKQYPEPDQTFEQFYSMWKEDLRKIANEYAWRFRKSSSTDHVAECSAELHTAFWLAYLHWRPASGEFGKYFWSIWLNRLVNHVRYINAGKRKGEEVELTEGDDTAKYDAMFDIIELPIFNCHELEMPVIRMLAQGFRPAEVIEVFGQTIYTDVVHAWRDHYIEMRKG